VAVHEQTLFGRDHECGLLDQLLESVLVAQSQVLVLRGEAGIGKSALLDHLAQTARDCWVTRAAGVESEMELAYAGLHRLCGSMLHLVERLPATQRDAIGTAFGLSPGAAPDRYLVGLATLTLFANAAEHRALVCIVDDAQWLDDASVQILGFVALRLLAERIGLVFASRTGNGDPILAGLPELIVNGLDAPHSRALLLSNLLGPIDTAVCDRIVAESRGNPLALLELPRGWEDRAVAGGFGVPDTSPVADKIEQSYARRLASLPKATQLLVLVAAAEPLGDRDLFVRAAEILDLDTAEAEPAKRAGLLRIGERIEFAHPLVRSAAYRSATIYARRRAHDALAAATDSEVDPDRRAWHLAQATVPPDEYVATELERSASRARSRGGVAAAAAFLRRATTFTRDPHQRSERALLAAEATLQSGGFDAARRLGIAAEALPMDELQRARVELLRGRVAFASELSSNGPSLLLRAATRLEPFDPGLARETYLTAWGAAVFAGDANYVMEICRAVRDLPPTHSARPIDLLLDGIALLTTEGRDAAVATLQDAVKLLTSLPVDDVLRWGWAATGASDAVWDIDGTLAIAERQVQLVRDAGALAELPIHLAALGLAKAWSGDFPGVASLIAESDSVAAATGSPIAPYALLRLRALQGSEAETSRLIAQATEKAAAGGQGLAAAWAHWSASVLYNGLARYEDAISSAKQATANTFEPWAAMWALPELVEAATHLGDAELARDALERLAETTRPCGTDFARGIEARSRALASGGPTAEDLYLQAVEHLGRTPLRPESGRAHLVYGEWLRREGRRVDAREQFRAADDMFTTIGMEAFAERARRELIATGEKARKRTDDTRGQLTPQEEQIARLARDGLSNQEIAAQLFVSPRTVEWHLRKAFAKLGINSRMLLRGALPEGGRTSAHHPPPGTGPA
jgi:DNA-binding CsgD family transcriptional regulator/tetratricopeptide (TPR) repeat protein